MKRLIKINMIITAAIIMAAVLFTSSCKKEEGTNPAANPSQSNSSPLAARALESVVFPPGANMYGNSYSVWSEKWWTWAMNLPADANHPFNDSPGFDITEGQTGDVWFLAGVFSTSTRNCTIPEGKALFVALSDAEASNLEGYGTTYAQLLAGAISQADLFTNVFGTVDGIAINDIDSYHFISPAPPFKFNAPTPWIYGATGGAGISVADGWYIMVKPLSKGTHTLHFGGDVPSYGISIDQTYNLTVK